MASAIKKFDQLNLFK